MEEVQQDSEQPEVMRCTEPRSHCSPIETDSLEAAATVSLHGPSPEVQDCGTEGPFPCKSDGIKSSSSTNGPSEPELQGPGGEGPSERASNTNEVERASDLSEVERALNLSEVKSASKPSEEERLSNLSEEERLSNLSEEERVSNLSEEERVSNLSEEERVSNLSEEERVSIPSKVETVSNLSEEERVSIPSEEERVSNPSDVERASNLSEEERLSNEVSAGEINGQSQPQGSAKEEEDQPENVSDSASTDNTLEDSSEFVVTVLARATLEDQGEGPPSGLSEASTPAQGPAPSNQDEDVTAESWRRHRKHVFVLSEAGKPIYSRYGNEEALSSTMGVMMALVSFVQSGDNAIRSIYSDEHTVVFMQQGPLVLVSVSCSRQSEQQLRSELIYVYNQIVSMLTQASINRIFERKKNYDLRRLLAGSEKILDGLLNLVDSDPSFLLSAVHCLPLASSLRDSLSQILQKAITPNLVFSILIAKNQLLTIVQEKTVIEDARLEPADLHLLLNLIGASSAFQAGEIWTPICLPLFNPDCYFYAYISYLDPPECTVCLLLLSTDKEAFYAVAECKRKIDQGMRTQNALCSIAKAQPYSASQVGVSDLRHFMYKPFDVPDNHRQLTQFTSPEMEAPYSSEEEKTRLLDLYRYMHSRIHSNTRPLKLIYHVAERETLLAWVTSKFELYTCFSPLVTKASAINAITKLLRWIKKEEDYLFIRSPPKYSTTPNPSKSSRGGTTDNGFLTLL